MIKSHILRPVWSGDLPLDIFGSGQVPKALDSSAPMVWVAQPICAALGLEFRTGDSPRLELHKCGFIRLW